MTQNGTHSIDHAIQLSSGRQAGRRAGTHVGGHVEHGGLAGLGLLVHLLAQERPELVHVHRLGVGAVLQQVEVAHADLQSKINEVGVVSISCSASGSRSQRDNKNNRPAVQGACRQTHLAEVTGVVLVHQDAVVVLATGVTAPTCLVSDREEKRAA